MLDEVGVIEVRKFQSTKKTLGVGKDDGSYFVYDRDFGAPAFDWHMHCGPYSTFDQAAAWIHDILETAPPRSRR